MWFWWFLMGCNILVPIIMAVFGIVMWKRCPKKINAWYGYRTEMSMKNMDTWRFAHEYCGNWWWRLGFIILVPSVLVMLPFYNATESSITVVYLISTAIQIIFMIFPIVKTERALKERFNLDGTPKNEN